MTSEHPTDEEIMAMLPATCPEIAAKLMPRDEHEKRFFARNYINRRMNSMARYRMVRWDGKIRGGAKIWVKN